MKRMYLGPIAVLFAVYGCSSGGDSAPVASPDPSLTITSSNAMDVAKVAYEAALGSQELAGAGDGFFIASEPGVISKVGNSGAQVPIPAETIPCAVSGTTTISGDIADIITPTITAGDFIQIEFDACDDGFDEITDGVVRTDFEAFSGDFLTGAFSMTAMLTLTEFQASLFDGQSATPIDVISTNGAITLTADSTDFPFVSTSINGNSLVVDTNNSTESLTNFASASTVDGNVVPSPFTNSALGTLDSTQLAGVISYSTPLQFEGLGVDFPSSGEFLVEGSASSLLLVAEDNVNVRIEIDLGADGTIDETINTTWVELTSS